MESTPVTGKRLFSVEQLAIVVPVCNEGARASKFCDQLHRYLTETDATSLRKLRINIVVVDDGSREPFQPSSDAWQGGEIGVYLLRHPVNLGQGAALETGIQYARDKLGCEYFVTMDSDGQHRPEDIPALIGPLQNGGVDIVFGNRFMGSPVSAPPLRRLILKMALLFEYALTRVRVSDAHNGFRAMNRHAAGFVRFKQARMAHATEIKQIVSRNRLAYAEASVQILYTDESLAKGQKSPDLVVILRDLLDVYFFRNG